MEFNELIKLRRSVRAYEQCSITEDEIKELIDATVLAPSWRNVEASRYYIALREDIISEIREKSLQGINFDRTENAAAFIVTTYLRHTAGTGKIPAEVIDDEWGPYDLGLQNAYLVLKASDMGYDTLIMGKRDADAVRKVMNIPEDEEVATIIALGKRKGDAEFKPRKTFEEIAKIF